MNKVDKFNEFLRDKKIAIIGAGVSNIPLIDYLSNLTDKLYLFDKNDLSSEIMDKVNKYNISISIGEDYLEKLVGFNVIFRSPSCLPTNPYLIEEKKRGAYITTEVAEVVKMSPCSVIGITGSDGKTTTTTLISKILSSLGYNVYTGGNIGTPLFSVMDKIIKEDIIVLELSSFQLMDMDISCNVSVVTNISPNHLDFHSSYAEYIEAKKNIFKYQSKDDVLVLNYDDELVRSFSEEVSSNVRYFSSKSNLKDCYILDGKYIKYNDEVVLNVDDLKIKGIHNYINICTALNALVDYVDDMDKVVEVICNFTGVEHRIEFVRELNGVKFYNDSASSSPSRTIAGISAFDEDLILIAGGSDKNIPFDALVEPILNKVRVLILYGETKDKIYSVIKKNMDSMNKYIDIYVLESLDEVVNKALEVSKSGEVVLFSPASASFDMFKNAYHRGNEFKRVVNEL